jgi:hypothetical protein
MCPSIPIYKITFFAVMTLAVFDLTNCLKDTMLRTNTTDTMQQKQDACQCVDDPKGDDKGDDDKRVVCSCVRPIIKHSVCSLS